MSSFCFFASWFFSADLWDSQKHMKDSIPDCFLQFPIKEGIILACVWLSEMRKDVLELVIICSKLFIFLPVFCIWIEIFIAPFGC